MIIYFHIQMLRHQYTQRHNYVHYCLDPHIESQWINGQTQLDADMCGCEQIACTALTFRT